MPVWTQHHSPTSYNSFSVIPYGPASVLPRCTPLVLQWDAYFQGEDVVTGILGLWLQLERAVMQLCPLVGWLSRPYPASWTYTFV